MAITNRDAGPSIRATRARSGRPGRSVLLVLLVGTILAAVGLFAAWALRSDDLASAPANNGPSTSAQQFEAPIPAPVTAPPEEAAATPR